MFTTVSRHAHSSLTNILRIRVAWGKIFFLQSVSATTLPPPWRMRFRTASIPRIRAACRLSNFRNDASHQAAPSFAISNDDESSHPSTLSSMSCHSSREWRQKHLHHQEAITQVRSRGRGSCFRAPPRLCAVGGCSRSARIAECQGAICAAGNYLQITSKTAGFPTTYKIGQSEA